ncbi:polyprenyl synthetase family protein [Paratractidigestivibacter sp.]|uniref:polyprenyl synthetase family protein n=1 Tax=Paratractidigestivibacter sp. TaxID=2847316 RepID=UPI002AC9B4D9|nr:polyprenyl synthetase family protein [Paratractidigestivibacter sp.]
MTAADNAEKNVAAPAADAAAVAAPGARFAAYLGRVRPQIEAYLARTAPACEPGTADATRADLDRYLYAPFARFSASGGKRTRPALCLLGCEAVGSDPALAMSAAAAIENFQSAALIHDDIADKSELRRGEPCTYITEGTGVAINIGDLGLAVVLGGVLRDEALPTATRLAVMGRLFQMEERTIEGQALDLGWVRDGHWDVSVDDYLYMASHKTAYYSAAIPLATGAIVGGGTDEQIRALDAFGMAAGLAFQLQDDLLNLVGDAAAQGKDFRSDITEGKRTMLVVWALEHLGAGEKDELVGILQSGETDPDRLARAVELIDAAGAIDHVRAYARDLVAEAKRHLRGVGLAEEARETLVSMADFFVERTS